MDIAAECAVRARAGHLDDGLAEGAGVLAVGLTREQERAAWYLAGIFDGEGCVSFKAGSRGLTHKYVGIDNTDISIIETVRMALDVLKIPYVERGPIYFKNERWMPYYSIRVITYTAIYRFAELVPVQSVAKRDKLDSIVASPRRVMGRENWPLEEIKRLYWEEGLDVRGVAARLGIGGENGHKRVLYYMEQSGIPRRTRSEAASRRWTSSG